MNKFITSDPLKADEMSKRIQDTLWHLKNDYFEVSGCGPKTNDDEKVPESDYNEESPEMQSNRQPSWAEVRKAIKESASSDEYQLTSAELEIERKYQAILKNHRKSELSTVPVPRSGCSEQRSLEQTVEDAQEQLRRIGGQKNVTLSGLSN